MLDTAGVKGLSLTELKCARKIGLASVWKVQQANRLAFQPQCLGGVKTPSATEQDAEQGAF